MGNGVVVVWKVNREKSPLLFTERRICGPQSIQQFPVKLEDMKKTKYHMHHTEVGISICFAAEIKLFGLGAPERPIFTPSLSVLIQVTRRGFKG